MINQFASATVVDFFAFFKDTFATFASLAIFFLIASLISTASFFEKLSIIFACFLDSGDTSYFETVV